MHAPPVLDLGIGNPHEKMEILGPLAAAAADKVDEKWYHNFNPAYKPGAPRDFAPITPSGIFRALDPAHPHKIPDTLALMETVGSRGALFAFFEGLRAAADVIERKINPGKQEGDIGYQTIGLGVVLPGPTYGGFTKIVENRCAIIDLPLKEEEGWAITRRALCETMIKADARSPYFMVGGLVCLSPHSPSGKENGYNDVLEIYKALESLQAARKAKLIDIMGGQENLKRFMQDPEFAQAFAILAHPKIFEDMVYFGSEMGAPSVSFHEIAPQYPGVHDHVFTSFSISKCAGYAGQSTGLATGSENLVHWMSRHSQGISSYGLDAYSKAALEIGFNSNHPRHAEVRAFYESWGKRLAQGRATAEREMQQGGGVEGVRLLSGGQSGMYRLLQFDRSKGPWARLLQPYLEKPTVATFNIAGVKLVTPQYMRMHEPGEALRMSDDVFRINIDAGRAVDEAFGRIREASRLAA